MNKLIFPNRQFEVKNKVGESYTEKKSLENYKAGNGKHTFNNPHACLGFPFSLMISVGDESIDALQLFFFFTNLYFLRSCPCHVTGYFLFLTYSNQPLFCTNH